MPPSVSVAGSVIAEPVFAHGTAPPPSVNLIEREDGSGSILLEDGSGSIQLEA